MAYALTIMLLWLLIFLPAGAAFQWLVLGENGRHEALPIALCSGLALGMVVLAALVKGGVDITLLRVPLVVAGVVAAAWVARRRPRRAGRDVAGAFLLLLVSVVLVSAAVWDGFQSGPLSAGSGRGPVDEVSQLRAVIDGTEPAASYPGFPALAGFTLSMGDTWDPHRFHALLTGIFAALVSLPVFLFARFRGIGRPGTFVAVVLGVVSPLAFLVLAFANGAQIASLPFGVCALLSLLLARRDRGWLALAALHSVAVLVAAGPLALIPLAVVAVAWLALARRVREHLSRSDTPVSADRPLLAGVVVLVIGVFAAAEGVVALDASAWRPVFGESPRALLAWPFSWLDPQLQATVPREAVELAVWLMGPALLAIAVAYGIVRREYRELIALAGLAGSLALGTVIAVFDSTTGVSVVEYTWLVGTPLLAVICVRTAGLARAATAESDSGRLAGFGPLLLFAVVGLLWIAAATTTGGRMTPAPALARAEPYRGHEALTLGRVRWAEYLLSGAHVIRVDASDFDELTGSQTAYRSDISVSGPVILAANNDPLASDPPPHYEPDPDVFTSNLPGRLFRGVLAAETVDASTAKPTVVGPASAPKRHDPLERPGASPGGVLLPPLDGSSSYPTVVDECPEPRGEFAASAPNVCLRVPLDPAADKLLVHVRHVGFVWNATEAHAALPQGAWEDTEFHGRPARSTSQRDARLQFDTGLNGPYRLTLEGELAGARITTALSTAELDNGLEMFTLTRGHIDEGFTASLGQQLNPALEIENTQDAPVTVSRVFASSSTRRHSCNLVVDVQVGAESRSSSETIDPAGGAAAAPAELSARVIAIDRSSDGSSNDTVTVQVTSRMAETSPSGPEHVLLDYIQQYADNVPAGIPVCTSAVDTTVQGGDEGAGGTGDDAGTDAGSDAL